jgi:hypothetical protein
MARRAPAACLVAVATVALALLATTVLAAATVGRVKTAVGSVRVQRGAQPLGVIAGLQLQQGDVIITGADGSAGIVFADDSRLSVGPNTTLAIDKFVFDPTTHRGSLQTSLKQGTLAAVSGKLARQSPEAMTIRTPVAVMAVRGTRVLVRASDGQ